MEQRMTLAEHFKKGTFTEQYWLPEHDERKESNLFYANKRYLRDIQDLPCWICGSKKDREVHHVFEWAFWEALDRKKVSAILESMDFYTFAYTRKANKPEELVAEVKTPWIRNPILENPDDIRNLIVLCREHHRLKLSGVHTISFPVWLVMAAVPDEGGILTKEQILAAVSRVQVLDQEIANSAARNYECL
jgi:hypothetical protein